MCCREHTVSRCKASPDTPNSGILPKRTTGAEVASNRRRLLHESPHLRTTDILRYPSIVILFLICGKLRGRCCFTGSPNIRIKGQQGRIVISPNTIFEASGGMNYVHYDRDGIRFRVRGLHPLEYRLCRFRSRSCRSYEDRRLSAAYIRLQNRTDIRTNRSYPLLSPFAKSYSIIKNKTNCSIAIVTMKPWAIVII